MPSQFEISESEIRERCAALLNAALDEAHRMRHNYIGTEHIYNAITKIEDSFTCRLLRDSNFEPRLIRNDIRREVGAGDDEVQERPPLTPRARRVLGTAIYYAEDYNTVEVSDVYIMLALLQDGEGVAIRKLKALGANIDLWMEKLITELERMAGLRLGAMDEPHPDFMESDKTPTPEKTMQSVPTPLLDKYGRDLIALARQGKLNPAVGRDREIRIVARTLSRKTKNNPLLLGDAGVGKTAVIEGLAFNIAEGTAPHPLRGKRIIQIEIGSLVAGTSLRGQFEERLVGIVDEARNSPNVILFIDEIHTIVGAGDTIDSNLDAANILKPALSRGEIACIGATTHEEYRKAIMQDSALDRRFRVIDIDEPSEAITLQIVQGARARYEEHHHVTIQPEALTAAVRLSSKYLINRRQPDKSVDLLDEACARVVIQTGSLTGSRFVSAATIAEVLAEWTGIPVHDLTSDERRKFARMESDLKARVIGQEHAIQTVAAAIKTNRAGLSDPNRPVGVFLFLGPSGVGKTELAKALAAFLFGSEDALIRLDMSEFHDEHTVARLIGSPPGYKDSARGGQLTEALRRKPYSVILLDEVEKAVPEVFDLFLQTFDDGRLTDARGVTYDARQAVWIMTSNIGTAEAGRSLGFEARGSFRPPVYEQHLKKFFRPEFLNRLDETVIFNPLSMDSLNEILELHIRSLRDRLTLQGLSLKLSDDARVLLLGKGFDLASGARPLRRTLEKLLITPLSHYLLMHECAVGSVIEVSAGEGGLQFEAHSPAGRA